MSTFVVTLIVTVILAALALVGLCIGLILTGKPKIKRGSCGYDPTKKRDPSCGKNVKCPLCEEDPDDRKDR
ncbi:MAG: hypothetical protein JSR80_03665 [Verrucomicrobia bacterium]|nr:hypothetical protein [Verrucomicrobiota bacterium]